MVAGGSRDDGWSVHKSGNGGQTGRSWSRFIDKDAVAHWIVRKLNCE